MTLKSTINELLLGMALLVSKCNLGFTLLIQFVLEPELFLHLTDDLNFCNRGISLWDYDKPKLSVT